MLLQDSFYLEAVNEVASAREAPDIVAWASRTFGGNLVMSSSFGAESAVLIHMAVQVNPAIRVIMVDTGFLFHETHAFMEQLRRRFNLNLHVYRPRQDPQHYLAEAGETNPDQRQNIAGCCATNKNEPFERAMRELAPRAWLRGIRRQQAATRRDRQIVEWSDRFNCYAISPLLNWSTRQVHTHMKQHDLPFHPLYEQGYLSIGCSPSSCTRPVQIGEDARAGRWAGTAKLECGLHL